jgi:hypothetical protein
MADNHDFVEPGSAPDGTTLRTVRALDIDNKLHPVTVLFNAAGTALADQQARTGSLPVALSTEDAALISAITTALGNVSTEAKLETVRALLAGFLSVGGSDGIAVGTMTRPADTSTYTAGDGVTTSTSAPAAMMVVNCARVNGGSGRIIGARVIKSGTTTTVATFRLWVWAVVPAIPNDNAAYSPTVRANNADFVGYIDVSFVSGAITVADGLMVNGTLSRPNMGFKCASGTRDLVVVWQATGAYPPNSAETFAVAFDVAQN